jgi:hypothetical protein
MATSQACCHLPSKMLNSAAKCADRARISFWSVARAATNVGALGCARRRERAEEEEEGGENGEKKERRERRRR